MKTKVIITALAVMAATVLASSNLNNKAIKSGKVLAVENDYITIATHDGNTWDIAHQDKL